MEGKMVRVSLKSDHHWPGPKKTLNPDIAAVQLWTVRHCGRRLFSYMRPWPFLTTHLRLGTGVHGKNEGLKYKAEVSNGSLD
jgi:hypothetical protein